MKFYYDFHIHTCLSPCGDEDMTPLNIAGMAKLIGLDAIAVTDHNTARNARAVAEASAAMDGPLVIPGMEVETEEGIHIVMLFPTFDAAEAASEDLASTKPNIPNQAEYYGRQLICDGEDNVIGEEKYLLTMPTSLDLYSVKAFADKYGAAAYPAHIDREANGILAILGDIDRDMGFSTAELSKTCPPSIEEEYSSRGYKIIHSSDAHYLDALSERENFLELDSLSAQKIVELLKR